ncbi:MAG: fumarylacetoacetate hydrolase family protein [Crocinitomicaceae bacterium]|nr:fumarylacetoacetate hydrolase family protein [Crocinitomicaceae bacterium]
MKIICIGRNYSEHAKEMNAAVPTQPMFFLKPDTALNRENKFYIPSFSNNVHYELEIVVKISKVGKSIDPKFAHKYYNEFTLGIDFTARDLQAKCKEKGHPWEIAKGFDNSAFLASETFNKEDYDLNNLNFELLKNNESVQKGSSSDMIFKIDELIAYVSKFITLKQGDLLFTGTPSGVGQIVQGDQLIGKLEDKKAFELAVL